MSVVMSASIVSIVRFVTDGSGGGSGVVMISFWSFVRFGDVSWEWLYMLFCFLRLLFV